MSVTKTTCLLAGSIHPTSMDTFAASHLFAIACAKFMALEANGDAPMPLAETRVLIGKVQFGKIGTPTDRPMSFA